MGSRRTTGGALLVAALCAGPWISAPASRAVAAGPAAQSAEKQATEPVNVNTATEEELATVRGIGKVLARRIVEFRGQHGPFRKIEDLLKVQGIGEKSFEKLRPYLTVEKSR